MNGTYQLKVKKMQNKNKAMHKNKKFWDKMVERHKNLL